MKTALLSPTPRVSKCVSAKEANWNETFHAFEFRFRRLFEAAPHGILLLNSASGEITDANPFAVDLLDYPFDELCGRELWEIGRYEDIAVSRANFKKLQETSMPRPISSLCGRRTERSLRSRSSAPFTRRAGRK